MTTEGTTDDDDEARQAASPANKSVRKRQRKRRHEASDLSPRMEDDAPSPSAKCRASSRSTPLIFYNGTRSDVAPHSSAPGPMEDRQRAQPARHVDRPCGNASPALPLTTPPPPTSRSLALLLSLFPHSNHFVSLASYCFLASLFLFRSASPSPSAIATLPLELP